MCVCSEPHLNKTMAVIHATAFCSLGTKQASVALTQRPVLVLVSTCGDSDENKNCSICIKCHAHTDLSVIDIWDC